MVSRKKYHFNTKNTLTIVYKSSRKVWCFRYFTIKRFWYKTRLFLPPKQVSCSSPFPPKILHRYSIDSPSIVHRFDGETMEKLWRSDGWTTENERNDSIFFPTRKAYFTWREIKKGISSQSEGGFSWWNRFFCISLHSETNRTQRHKDTEPKY